MATPSTGSEAMENAPLELKTPWYIGLHDSRRETPVSGEQLRFAQEANYDMLTSPITTPHFRANVLNILSTYYDAVKNSSVPDSLPMPLVPALTPLDTSLRPDDTVSQIIFMTSAWIDLASHDPAIRNVSQQVFNLEVAYAAFCGVQHIVVHMPELSTATRMDHVYRAVLEALGIGPYIQIHIKLDLGLLTKKTSIAHHVSSLSRASGKQQALSVSEWSSWESWNSLRVFCNYNARLSVAIHMDKNLPSSPIISRWESEPLRLIFIPQSTFLPNKYNQPVLPRAHKAVLYRYMRLRSCPWILLGDVPPVPEPGSLPIRGLTPTAPGYSPWPTPSEGNSAAEPQKKPPAHWLNDPMSHLRSVRNLQETQPARPAIERFGQGYQDYLQAPLQPLADNLESITYEVFEKDPIKYDWYQRAIEQALVDWTTENRSTSSGSDAVVIAVAGSGRGPLVARALLASKITARPVQVWAIEKNPNAYVHLQRRNQEEWDDQVTVVKTDMRAWKGPSSPTGECGHVDILVSELLGSFADNELSPECLDGVQHVLNPIDGISIPASYTAHLTPISTPKLYADLRHKSSGDKDAFELPYVVMLHQHDYLSTTPTSSTTTSSQQDPTALPNPNILPCWEFKHPLPSPILTQSSLRQTSTAPVGYGGAHGGSGSNDHNLRSCLLTFPLPHRGTCHGLAGYFETVLYTSTDIDDLTDEFVKVELSTNPLTMERKSRDMISWFPIFFPLRRPVSFPDGAEMEVGMWRCGDGRGVWYEWCVWVFVRVQGTGERVCIAGGERHSSKANACLM